MLCEPQYCIANKWKKSYLFIVLLNVYEYDIRTRL